MGGKKFGSLVSTANTDSDLYTVPSGKSTSMTINVCNTSTVATTVRISIGNDVIESATPLEPNGVLERTGLIAVENEIISVKASVDGVTFRAYGIEE